MGKKNFTSGLESVFGVDSSESFIHGADILPKNQKSKKAKRSRKGKYSKDFTSDLDSIFESVLAQPAIDSEEQSKKAFSEDDYKTKKKRTRRPLSGLDALIRSTVDLPKSDFDTKEWKRITFTAAKRDVAKLKKIARKEKKYIKEIMGSLLEEFVSNYEKNKGDIN